MQGSRAVADSDEKASSPTVPAIAAAWVIFSLSLLQLLRYARFNVPAARSLARLRRLATARLHQLQRLARQHLGSPAQRLARVKRPDRSRHVLLQTPEELPPFADPGLRQTCESLMFMNPV